MLKALSRTWWGADPVTLRLAYNGLVRSHLDYGTFFIQPASKKTLNKLDTLQNQALRIITGCMKSTPIEALLAEGYEMNLLWRRRWLATKFICKRIGSTEHPIINIIEDIKRTINTKAHYWKYRAIPDYIWGLGQIQKFNKIMHKEYSRPCFQIDFETQFTGIPTINLGLKKNFENKNIFNLVTEKLIEKYTFIYTDASKIDDKLGIAVHIPSLNYNYMERVATHLNICDAEILAINKAGTICLQQHIQKGIIFSDSKSAIQKLSQIGVNINNDHITLQTKRLILDLNNTENTLILAWVPGHTGIQGNVIVDQLAKAGGELDKIRFFKMVPWKMIPNIKKEIKTKYADEWKNRMQSKWYKDIQDNFPYKPWYLFTHM